MSSRMQHLLRTTSALLVLIVLLSGPAPSVTAREARQDPAGQIVQGYGDFPRLPIIARGADGAMALYLVEGNRVTQLVTLEGTRAGSNSAVRYVQRLDDATALRRRMVTRETQAEMLDAIEAMADMRPVPGAASERSSARSSA